MSDPVIHPSATVVLLQDTADGMKTLLLLRNKSVSVGGGEWVFPGGKVEPEELDAHADIDLAERVAAARECHEEAGIILDPASLEKYSHWVTPDFMPKRFSTGFYAVVLEQQHEVRVDNSEIVDHCWVSPAEALALHGNGELSLMPPTFVSLCDLQRYQRAEEFIQRCRDESPKMFEPRIKRLPSGACMLYNGDREYGLDDTNEFAADGHLSGSGALHRLIMSESGYEYICNIAI